MREIRTPSLEDLDALQGIEAAADAAFTPLFGPAPFGTDGAEDGRSRAAQPGYLRVLAERPAGPPIGFVHVLEPEAAPELAHLEQLAVRPEHGRRGHGRALIEAALVAATERGHERMTLRTYADVAWNAPFYGRCGFREFSPPSSPSHPGDAFLLELAAAEDEAGLSALGRRVLMQRVLTSPAGAL